MAFQEVSVLTYVCASYMHKVKFVRERFSRHMRIPSEVILDELVAFPGTWSPQQHGPVICERYVTSCVWVCGPEALLGLHMSWCACSKQ